MRVSGHTRVFGLLGHPVRHSLSPRMHSTLFQEYAIDAVYVAFDVDPRRVGAVAQAIRTLDLQGVNLTVPFKSGVLADLDHRTRATEEAQACNVVIQHGGVLTGYNTDGEGYCRSFEQELGLSLDGRSVVVLGAGGAARAIAASAVERGARSVRFLNRTVARAEESAAHLERFFGSRFEAAPLTSEAFRAVAGDTQLVVNCTSAGAEKTIGTFDVDRLPPEAVWSDINYWMEQPPGISACRHRGLVTHDGLGMLVHQGALSFELFTGVEVDATALLGVLRSGGS